MRKLFATLGAAVIIFVWQFLSWAALGIHANETKHTPNQDRIMQVLNENLSEEGYYFLPIASPDASLEDAQAVAEANAGKPWARISYHNSMDTGMGMNLIRGFAADLLAAFLLVWLLLQFGSLDMKTAIVASLAVGSIGFIAFPYLESIWFKFSTLSYLLDTGVQWLLVGTFLGWYLTRKTD